MTICMPLGNVIFSEIFVSALHSREIIGTLGISLNVSLTTISKYQNFYQERFQKFHQIKVAVCQGGLLIELKPQIHSKP